MMFQGYLQDAGSLVVKLSYDNGAKLGGVIGVKLMKYVPRTIDDINTKGSSVMFSIAEDNNLLSIIISVRDIPEPDDREYSIFILCGEDNYLEIVRQSQQYLEHRFNFRRLDGYSILGRRSLSDGQINIVDNSPAKHNFYGVVKLSTRIDEGILGIRCFTDIKSDELMQAIKLLGYLISLPLNTGPIAINHYKYEFSTFPSRIKMLTVGSYAVQCSGYRDLFVWLCLSYGLKMRSVDARNHLIGDESPDLVSYGHSLCEIYIDSIKKWVIFDPWFAGLMVVGSDGLPLSVKDVVYSASEHNSWRLIAAYQGYTRHIVDGFGNRTSYYFDSEDVSLTEYHFNRELGSCMPGYLDYFRIVTSRDAVIRSRSTIYISKINKIMKYIARNLRNYIVA